MMTLGKYYIIYEFTGGCFEIIKPGSDSLYFDANIVIRPQVGTVSSNIRVPIIEIR